MIELAVAQQHVLDRVSVLDAVAVPVVDACGLVLAEDVVAPNHVPPFANTAMDGIAVHTSSLVVDPADGLLSALRVVGTVAAGAPAVRPLGVGEAVRIMTGAPVPDGADAVVMVELCRFNSDADGVEWVRPAEVVPPGNHIRPVGDDVGAGDVVLRAGAPITPGALGLLRTLGLDTVRVVRRPRVGVMSTGDELVEPPLPLGPGQIYDSNRAALLALVAQNGFEAIDLGLIPDDSAAIEAALGDAVRRCDAVLTSGGVSMGDFDLVKVVLDTMGDMQWMQIAIRPAKPFAFGTLSRQGAADGTADGAAGAPPDDARSVPVFGLPGNPVSSMVSFELLARPGLRKMAGHTAAMRPTIPAVAAEAFPRRSDGKIHFPRVVVRPSVTAGPATLPEVWSAGGQGSHHLGSMALANGFAVIPDGDGVATGDAIDVLLVGEL